MNQQEPFHITDNDLLTRHYQDNKIYQQRTKTIMNQGTNPQNFWEWTAEQYHFKEEDSILEVGCGDGALWDFLHQKLHDSMSMTVTDFSPGMLQVAKEKLGMLKLPHLII